jgi:hypothetical protein
MLSAEADASTEGDDDWLAAAQSDGGRVRGDQIDADGGHAANLLRAETLWSA